MNGKTHTVLGVSTAVALCITNPTLEIEGTVLTTVWSIPLAFLGSLLPDIDLEQSTMGKKHRWIAKHLKHRGITHTLLVPALIGLLIWFLLGKFSYAPDLLLGLEIGWVAHIVADMFNTPGVPLFWPIMRGRVHVANVQTSSTKQQVVFIILWEVVLLAWIWLTYKGSIMTLLNI